MLSDVYKSEPRFLLHLQRQKANINQYKTEIGATDDDISEVTNDEIVFQWLISLCDSAGEFKETAFGVKHRFFSTKEDPPAGDLMKAPAITPPADIIAGAVKRSRDRDQRFLDAKDLSEAARIAMDLVGDGGTDTPPDAVKPTVKYDALGEGCAFDATVTGKGEADMIGVQIRRLNQEKWTEIKTGTGKTVRAVVVPESEGKAERVEVRVQLYRKNQPYGQPSDPQYVTVNP